MFQFQMDDRLALIAATEANIKQVLRNHIRGFVRIDQNEAAAHMRTLHALNAERVEILETTVEMTPADRLIVSAFIRTLS